MAKFKPAKKKQKSTPVPPGGVGCVVLVISGIALVILFMYYVLSHANG